MSGAEVFLRHPQQDKKLKKRHLSEVASGQVACHSSLSCSAKHLTRETRGSWVSPILLSKPSAARGLHTPVSQLHQGTPSRGQQCPGVPPNIPIPGRTLTWHWAGLALLCVLRQRGPSHSAPLLLPAGTDVPKGLPLALLSPKQVTRTTPEGATQWIYQDS